MGDWVIGRLGDWVIGRWVMGYGRWVMGPQPLLAGRGRGAGAAAAAGETQQARRGLRGNSQGARGRVFCATRQKPFPGRRGAGGAGCRARTVGSGGAVLARGRAAGAGGAVRSGEPVVGSSLAATTTSCFLASAPPRALLYARCAGGRRGGRRGGRGVAAAQATWRALLTSGDGDG